MFKKGIQQIQKLNTSVRSSLRQLIWQNLFCINVLVCLKTLTLNIYNSNIFSHIHSLVLISIDNVSDTDCLTNTIQGTDY